MINMNSLTQPYLAGVKTAVGVPAVSLFVGLFGYGTMNQNINFDFSIMLGAVTLIWSMPALMTFTEVVSLGAGVWTVFVAIVFTNLRNIPMIVTALPLIRVEPKIGWNDLFIAQLFSPTAWTHSFACPRTSNRSAPEIFYRIQSNNFYWCSNWCNCGAFWNLRLTT